MKSIVWKDVEARAHQNIAGVVYQSEKHFDNQVDETAQAIFDNSDLKVIFVAGPSSSGKTTFSNLLINDLQALGIRAHYIGLDDFFINRDDVPFLPSGLRDFDNITALDLPLVHEVIGGLMNGDWVEVPEYDFLTGSRKADKRIVRLYEHDVVIVEGIHALNPVFSSAYDKQKYAKISIKPRRNFEMPSGRILTADELRLLRRSLRDFYTRGYSFEETAKQWKEVCAAESKYITPFMESADFKIDSAHEYELFIYKQLIGKYLEKCYIDEFQNARHCIAEVSNKQDIQIPEASLLNEFATFDK